MSMYYYKETTLLICIYHGKSIRRYTVYIRLSMFDYRCDSIIENIVSKLNLNYVLISNTFNSSDRRCVYMYVDTALFTSSIDFRYLKPILPGRA